MWSENKRSEVLRIMSRVRLEVCCGSADGLVFGFLHPDGAIGPERTRVLADLAREALDGLTVLGVTRVQPDPSGRPQADDRRLRQQRPLHLLRRLPE